MAEKAQRPYGDLYRKAMIEKAIATGVRCGPLAVLNCLLSFRNYESGQSRPGREKIKDQTGLGDRALDTALKSLRDKGLILPLAYLEGGRGRATCYGFCLPAWSQDTQNPRNIYQKPPQINQQTPAISAGPTEEQYLTDIKATAGRGSGDKVMGETVETRGGQTFTELLKGRQYGEARRIWDSLPKGGPAAPL